MPRLTRSAVESFSMRCPSKMTSPLVGRTMPMMVFMVVDFPQALPPSRQMISPLPRL